MSSRASRVFLTPPHFNSWTGGLLRYHDTALLDTLNLKVEGVKHVPVGVPATLDTNTNASTTDFLFHSRPCSFPNLRRAFPISSRIMSDYQVRLRKLMKNPLLKRRQFVSGRSYAETHTHTHARTHGAPTRAPSGGRRGGPRGQASDCIGYVFCLYFSADGLLKRKDTYEVYLAWTLVVLSVPRAGSAAPATAFCARRGGR